MPILKGYRSVCFVHRPCDAFQVDNQRAGVRIVREMGNHIRRIDIDSISQPDRKGYPDAPVLEKERERQIDAAALRHHRDIASCNVLKTWNEACGAFRVRINESGRIRSQQTRLITRNGRCQLALTLDAVVAGLGKAAAHNNCAAATRLGNIRKCLNAGQRRDCQERKVGRPADVRHAFINAPSEYLAALRIDGPDVAPKPLECLDGLISRLVLLGKCAMIATECGASILFRFSVRSNFTLVCVMSFLR